MKNYITIIIATLLINQLFSQKNNTSKIIITPLGNGQTKINWSSSTKNIKQISLQRSIDSSNLYKTIYSTTNNSYKQYSYTDFYPKSKFEVYYRLLIIDSEFNILFSKPFSRNNNISETLTLKPSNVIYNNKQAEFPKNKLENVSLIKDKKNENEFVKIISENDTALKETNNKKELSKMFVGVSSKMPDTYTLKETSLKKDKKNKSVKDETPLEYKAKNVKQRKQEIEKIINDSRTKNDTFKKEKSASIEKKVENENNKENIKLTKKNEDDVVVIANSKKNKKTQTDSSLQDNKYKQDSIINTAKKENNIISERKNISAIGKLIGKVINSKTGEPIIGATITIASSTIKKSATTDYNGAYSFNNLTAGVYTISVSTVGFAKKTIDINVINDDVTVQDFVLSDIKTSKLEDVEVKTTSGKKNNIETISALQILQKNAASVSDGISAEAIKRTPDRNTSDIMKRVSGASIQDDKFAIIRGLNDRYNAVFLNNAPLPSSESDRKAFAFDIFPSNMLDNLIITKTATPEMNADFAGGTININTKDIPTKDFQSVSFGMSYNTQATFQNRKYYKGGRWDFLGIDDGTRALNGNIPTTDIRNSSVLERAQFGKSFGNTWKTYEALAPMNYNFQYVKGLNIQKNNKDYIGVLFALTYSRSYNKTIGDRRGLFYNVFNTDPNITPQYTGVFEDITYNTQVLASAMANFTLKINENNKISFKNLFSINSDDRVVNRTGNVDFPNEPNLFSLSTIRWFTSNNINSSQLIGEHFIKKQKIKINWTGGFSSVNREIPNRRISSQRFDINDPLREVKSDVGSATQPSPDVGGAIFFSKLSENIKSLKLDIEKDFRINNFNNIKVKLGTYYQNRHRDFSARYLGIFYQPNTPFGRFDENLLSILDDGKIFDQKNFGRQRNGTFGFQLTEDYRGTDTYDAGSNLFANYGMIDSRIYKFIRLIGGVRIERFNQLLNSSENRNPIVLNTVTTDVLPSINLVFSLNNKQNLRFAYSKTLNRPEYRELAKFIYYDYTTRLSIEGDTIIKRALINNYDIRYEIFPGKGQMFSISGFYKNIKNPIELGFNPKIPDQAKYFNAQEATIKGIELEFRSNLGNLFSVSKSKFLSDLTAFGNLSIMKSNVSFDSIGKIDYGPDRPMQGQSPYLFNVGLIYQNNNGWSSTIQLNQFGQRIFIAGNSDEANLWEHTRPVIDLQIAKTFEKSNIEIKLNFRDILALPQIFFYDLNRNNRYDRDNTPLLPSNILSAETDKIFNTNNFGRVISANITYKF